jgi:hypothetical protein
VGTFPRCLGRRRVLKRYTWEATTRSYLAVLETIGKAAPRRSGLLPPSYFTDLGPDTDIGIEDSACRDGMLKIDEGRAANPHFSPGG